MPWSRSSKRPLRPLEEDALAVAKRAVDEERGVGDVGPEALRVPLVGVLHLLGVERIDLVDALQPHVLLPHRELDLLVQDLRVEQVLHADPDPGRLVGVGRADPAAGRPDLQVAELPLARAVERDVPRHDQVRVAGHEDEAGSGVAATLQVVELVDHDLRVDDAPRADRRRLAGDDPRGDLPDLVRLAVDDDRVPGVRAALVAADEVRLLGEQVDDLALPLVAPLRTDDHGGRHVPHSCRLRKRSAVTRPVELGARPVEARVQDDDTSGTNRLLY